MNDKRLNTIADQTQTATIHTEQAVVQQPERKSRKLLWVVVGFIILCVVVIVGVWLANTLIKIPGTPVVS